ncbi:MAG TPA: conjugative transposon protein TraK [Puia sp.]|nr:conjugative transposon protein TraK [Puia sp.]
MKFELFDTIERRFQRFRWLSLSFVLGASLLGCWGLYNGSREAERARKVVYVLRNGSILQATASGRDENLVVELRDHLRTFHHYFFDLDPNEKAIKASMNQSFYLADSSAKTLFDDQVEKGYINGLVSGNITVRVTLDSIWLDTHTEPYAFRCIGVQTFTRATSITTRSIVTRGYVRSINRADNNPHGFMIEQFAVEDNKDIKTVNR